MKIRSLFIATVLIMVILSGCRQKQAEPLPTLVPESQETPPYPAPLPTFPYPGPGESRQSTPLPYPAPVGPTPDPSAVPFRFDKPLKEGATVISGTGPAGVPIIIADLTFMGEELAHGTIGKDGAFSFKVQGLEAEHRIGLALDELEKTQWTIADFNNPGYFGDEARMYPNIGFFYDTAMVLGK